MAKKLFSFLASFCIVNYALCQCVAPSLVNITDLNPSEAIIAVSNPYASIFEYGPPGFTPGTTNVAGSGGTIINCLCANAVIRNLVPSTHYNFYARFKCGSMGGIDTYSPNSSVLSFWTPSCPNTETYDLPNGTTTLSFGGNGYYDNYGTSFNDPPNKGIENLIKFTPPSSGYYDVKISKSSSSIWNPGSFLLRQTTTRCDFPVSYVTQHETIDTVYSIQHFYADTFGVFTWQGSVNNFYFRIGPLNSAISYDLLFDSNDTNYISNTQNVTLFYKGCSLPSTPGVITGPALPHPGASGVSYSVPPVTDAGSYTWFVPTDAVITSGQGTTHINVNFASTFSGGNISVTADNICGSSIPRIRQLRTVVTVPDQSPPGSALPNDRNQPLQENGNSFSAEIFPNPSKGHFTAFISSGENNSSQLVIKDITGREVERKENILSGERVDFGYRLSNGIYFAEIIKDDSKKILILIKE